MEDSLGHRKGLLNAIDFWVLILVVMEDSLGLEEAKEVRSKNNLS